MREATSLVLSARLQAAGAKVRAYDPVAEEEARKLMPRPASSPTTRSSAVDRRRRGVLVTEWDEFKELDFGAVADGHERHARSSTGATRSTPTPSRRPG